MPDVRLLGAEGNQDLRGARVILPILSPKKLLPSCAPFASSGPVESSPRATATAHFALPRDPQTFRQLWPQLRHWL